MVCLIMSTLFLAMFYAHHRELVEIKDASLSRFIIDYDNLGSETIIYIDSAGSDKEALHYKGRYNHYKKLYLTAKDSLDNR